MDIDSYQFLLDIRIVAAHSAIVRYLGNCGTLTQLLTDIDSCGPLSQLLADMY
jgi:hypothetical protein